MSYAAKLMKTAEIEEARVTLLQYRKLTSLSNVRIAAKLVEGIEMPPLSSKSISSRLEYFFESNKPEAFKTIIEKHGVESLTWLLARIKIKCSPNSEDRDLGTTDVLLMADLHAGQPADQQYFQLFTFLLANKRQLTTPLESLGASGAYITAAEVCPIPFRAILSTNVLGYYTNLFQLLVAQSSNRKIDTKFQQHANDVVDLLGWVKNNLRPEEPDLQAGAESYAGFNVTMLGLLLPHGQTVTVRCNVWNRKDLIKEGIQLQYDAVEKDPVQDVKAWHNLFQTLEFLFQFEPEDGAGFGTHIKELSRKYPRHVQTALDDLQVPNVKKFLR